METFQRLIDVLLESTGLDQHWQAVSEWLKPQHRRRIVLAVGLSVLALLISLVYACSGGRPDVSAHVWVYDASSGALQSQRATHVSSDAVIAHRYACGAGEPFTGYLTKGVDEQRQIRTASGEWVAFDSEEGRQILHELVAERCPGELQRVDP